MADRRPNGCEECGRPGVIAQDLFPYLVEYKPEVIHRWMHQPCAEVFRVRTAAAAADRGPALPASSGDAEPSRENGAPQASLF